MLSMLARNHKNWIMHLHINTWFISRNLGETRDGRNILNTRVRFSSFEWTFLFAPLFFVVSVTNNFLERTRSERSVSYMLLGDRYEWVATTVNCWRKLCLRTSYARAREIQPRVEMPNAIRFRSAQTGRMWNLVPEAQIMAGARREEEELNYSAKVIIAVNKSSFVTLLCFVCPSEFPGPRNKIDEAFGRRSNARGLNCQRFDARRRWLTALISF